MGINIGSVYQTNNYGSVIILSKTHRTDYYTVQFLDTGTVKDFRGYQILNGCIRDPYAKDVCGVGCTGDIKTKGKYKTYYSIWHGMICRCYDEKNKRYDAYRNVSVCDRWLVFENFYNDACSLDGYDNDKIQAGMLVLDKDTKQRYIQNKVYSPETCIWLSKYENNRIQDSQQTPFIAISPSGEVFEDYNITDFAKRYNLERRHISGCLHGRCKTHKGWKFSYKEIV